MRRFVLFLIAALTAIAATVGLLSKPLERPLVIDAQSSGAWPKYAASPAQPHMLFSPCPLTGQNIPPRPVEKV